jgi:hypothetical protein
MFGKRKNLDLAIFVVIQKIGLKVRTIRRGKENKLHTRSRPKLLPK